MMLGFIQIENGCNVKGNVLDYALISRRNVKRAGRSHALVASGCHSDRNGYQAQGSM